ncbi:MAG: hypothetical protein GY940_18250 [bacterium]|nr:hypothetical protein [bacterium]
MIKGFGLLEVLITLGISIGILVVVFSTVSQSTESARKVMTHQQRMEGIFHTIDMLRSDLTNCGMRLREAAKFLNFPLFENSDYSFKVIYGIGNENLTENVMNGENIITINRNDFFYKGRKIILFDPEEGRYEIAVIKGRRGDQLTLSDPLLYDYPKNAAAIALKEVEYKLYSQQEVNSLKRKVNKGYFQPLLEDVTDFYVRFYPEANAVFYRVEIGKKEQIRGYILMVNMMEEGGSQ